MTGAVAATITWARTESEAALLCEGLRLLSAHGLPVVAADGGSLAGFTERVRGLPNLSLAPYQPGQRPRLVGQVQAALAGAAALGADYVLYTEPDKRWFFAHRLEAYLDALPQDAGVGMLIAARDERSFATFPAGQQLTETLTNQLLGEALGRAGDYLYGPLLIRADLVPHVCRIREDVGWGWRPYLMAVCRRLGLPIGLHTADHPCPEEQRGEDDAASRVYRMEQMAQNVKGLALGLKTPLE